MNKDNHISLTLGDRFNLFLSITAIEREFSKVKRPSVNVENLPSSIYYQQSNINQKNQGKPELQKTASCSKKVKKDELKMILKNQVLQQKEQAIVRQEIDEDLNNDKVSELIRCIICLSVPIYPKECNFCSQIVCDTCQSKYEKTKQKNMPVCVHCKTDDAQAYTDIKSKLLRDIIDRIKVGHKCHRLKQLEVFTVSELRRHVESGDCSGYNYKCFCGSQEKFTLETIRKHLKEDCEQVRLQCKFCHWQQNIPSGNFSLNYLNYFSSNSYSRQEFRKHSCYLEQQNIENNLQNQEILNKVKVLLLQNSSKIYQKSKQRTLNDFECKDKKCREGWFDFPAPKYLDPIALQAFNPQKMRQNNIDCFECQQCKKNFEELYQNPGNQCVSVRQDILERCPSCQSPICKYCLIQDYKLQEPSQNQPLSSGDIVLKQILEIVDVNQQDNPRLRQDHKIMDQIIEQNADDQDQNYMNDQSSNLDDFVFQQPMMAYNHRNQSQDLILRQNQNIFQQHV